EHHELVGQAAAHHADVGANRNRLEPETLEDAVVGVEVELIAAVQAIGVAVAAVAVLHDELADPDEAAAAARLVAELGLDVVHEQWQLSIAAHQVAEQAGDDVLEGHGQHHVATGAVLESHQLSTDLLF